MIITCEEIVLTYIIIALTYLKLCTDINRLCLPGPIKGYLRLGYAMASQIQSIHSLPGREGKSDICHHRA